ncbi:MAG: Acylphosphatase [Methanosaeta sp. PtaU1.Bin112]|nr:MAG: Acylphosphatase [Methanosaeta sp. PtaU1.Bin112]
MKLKIRIIGPRVHDVGYRYFLLSLAMSRRIKMFEAHNTESGEDDEVLVFAEGDDEAIKAFRSLVETKRPERSDVSKIIFEDFEGDIMKIGDYSQFCSTVQMNKAIPLLLNMSDDLREMRGDIKEMRGDIKEMRGDIKEMRGNIKEMHGDIKEMHGDIKEMHGDIKEMRKNTDAIPLVLEEIKGMREDIQPGYGMHFRQMQSDVRAIKERLGMQ